MPISEWLSNLKSDVRTSLRMLRRDPGFASVVVVTLALAIGLNTAIFSIFNAVLLQPLPFFEPGHLCLIFEKTPASERYSVPYPNFLDWQRRTHSFSSMAAFRKDNVILIGEDRPERLRTAMISAGFLSTLGIRPVVGREFSSQDDQRGAGPVVMLSEEFWHRRFGADPQLLERKLRLDDVLYTVVGVAPSAVQALKIPLFSAGDVYIPLGQWTDPSFRDRKVTTGMCVIGRLAKGTTLAEAQAEMSKVAADLAAGFPDSNRDTGVNVLPLKQTIAAAFRPTVLVLLFAVSFVLLIACANVSNLLLARSLARLREFATRVALGASRNRVASQLLIESLTLAFIGGAVGVLLAVGAIHAALPLIPAEIPRPESIQMNGTVLGFAAFICMLAGIIFGLVPTLHLRRKNLAQTLREGGRGATNRRYAIQRLFIVLEVALTLVLLAGAGLMTQSLMHLWRVQPGFIPHHALTFEITPSSEIASDPARIRSLFKQLSDDLAAVPGVTSTAFVLDPLPLTGVADVVPFEIAGRAPTVNGSARKPSAIWYFVGPDYFDSMGIVLRRGRFFTRNDDEHAPQVAIIDENFARTMFPGEDPIGKQIHIGFTGNSQIVGVVAHVNHWNLGGEPPTAVSRQMYFPYSQLSDRYLPMGIKGGASVVVRSTPEPLSLVRVMQDRASRLDAGLALFNVRTVDGIVSEWLATRRFALLLLGLFAALALLLSGVGIYGVVSYIVGQRIPELGIRMTLGAQRADILRLVLGQGGILTAFGIGVGVIAAMLLSGFIRSLLYGVASHDLPTFLAAAALLLVIAMMACYFPARRALRLDPLSSLRRE